MPDDSLMHIGELRGRLISLESRLERHEFTTGAQLRQIDDKLSAIQDTLAQSKGVSSYAKWLVQIFFAAVSVAVAWIVGRHT